MECTQDDDFERLVKIAKSLFPTLIVFSFTFYLFYRDSVDTIEFEVLNKYSEYASHFTDAGCVEFEIFHIESINETLIATEDIYYQLEVDSTYLVGTNGWAFRGSSRKITKVY
jgi:hypothetical protein